MKKIFCFLIVMIVFFGANAQEHLTFEGIPIDGTLDQFTKQLENKGYEILKMEDNAALLKGSFEGNDNCQVIAGIGENKDKVGLVVVLSSGYKKWSKVYKSYSSLKNEYIKRYGEPIEINENFGDPKIRKPADIVKKLHEGNDYSCTFSLEQGNILLSVMYSSDLDLHLMIAYNDKINGVEE